MIKFLDSKIAPNPSECTYWIDLSEDPYFGSIKKYDGSKWVSINGDAEQNEEIQQIKNSLNNKVDKVSGKQLSTNDYTTVEKQKLSGIAANANNYSHPTNAGNKHIPAGGSANQILTWKANGEAQWSNIPSATISKATTDAIGGIKIGYTTSGKNYAVQLDSNDKAFVNVNWSDTKVTVNNTLTSTSTTEALSAAQGKVLKDALDALSARVEALETPAA